MQKLSEVAFVGLCADENSFSNIVIAGSAGTTCHLPADKVVNLDRGVERYFTEAVLAHMSSVGVINVSFLPLKGCARITRRAGRLTPAAKVLVAKRTLIIP